ncbi:hypothetical protein II906_07415 [bacterium]|nr:hypothetical protein [bacterium]
MDFLYNLPAVCSCAAALKNLTGCDAAQGFATAAASTQLPGSENLTRR